MNKLEWLTASGYKKMRREEREAQGFSPARFSPVLEDKEYRDFVRQACEDEPTEEQMRYAVKRLQLHDCREYKSLLHRIWSMLYYTATSGVNCVNNANIRGAVFNKMELLLNRVCETIELAEELEDIFNADAERLAAEVNSNTDRHNALERS